MIDDELVSYTRSLVDDKNRLTYSFCKGDLIRAFQTEADQLIQEIDERLDLDFKRINRPAKADLLIGYGDLPTDAAAAAIWTDTRWELRLTESFFSPTIFRHEMGHVLGLGHALMGTNSLMQPTWGGVGNFTHRDWLALHRTWGREERLILPWML